MPTKTPPNLTIRAALVEDAAVCGPICYAAFSAINGAHGFPCDLPGPDAGIGLFEMFFSHPKFYCVVAEIDGRVVGSNCLDERSTISGVGPITVDPSAQGAGVGPALMRAVLERAEQQGAAGVRLVQAAFHNRSLSLYAGLGFDVREPLSCVQGRTVQRSVPGCTVRPAQLDDLAACAALSRVVHGFDRCVELREGIEQGSAKLVERDGSVTGYASNLAFFGHATALTNMDMQALIASADSFGGPGILVPSRNSALFRWCLSNGLRVVQPMTLMSMGLYNESAGAWLASVTF